ncbi:MAG: RICIN domain-containing protein [Coriobacteriales bacterium]|nr:RICIN domain-containing protein [Coriobacteriales bacterium]
MSTKSNNNKAQNRAKISKPEQLASALFGKQALALFLTVTLICTGFAAAPAAAFADETSAVTTDESTAAVPSDTGDESAGGDESADSTENTESKAGAQEREQDKPATQQDAPAAEPQNNTGAESRALLDSNDEEIVPLDTVSAANLDALRAQINGAQNNTPRTIRITSSINLGAETLTIPVGKIITLANGSPTTTPALLTGTGSYVVYVTSGASLTIEGITITGSKGYGIRNYGKLTMSSGLITGCSSNGVYNYQGTFTMLGGTISGNTASYGGGIYNSSGTVAIKGGAISGNTASAGAGVYSSGGSLTMSGGSISNNTASSSFGGGVYFSGSGTFVMSGGSISGNSGYWGGGIYVSSSSSFTITGGSISNNAASSSGGGIDSSGALNIAGGTITNNTTGSYGGGISSTGPFVMKGGTISNNVANGSFRGGGGIHHDSLDFITLTGGTISNNSAPVGDGGGVYVYTYGTLTVGKNMTFFGNKAKASRNRHPDYNASYSLRIACTKWTSPHAQGYNNLDINHPGTPGSAPAIAGPSTIALVPGYGETVVGYTVSGNPTPSISLSSDTSHAVYVSERGLKIRSGLEPGTYVVTLKATNLGDVVTKRITIAVGFSNFSGTYTLGTSKKTLGIQKKSTKAKAYVELQSINYGPTQRFRLERVETARTSIAKDYYVITDVLSGKRLEVKGAKLLAGTPLWQNNATAANAQRFSLERNPQGGYWISPKGSELVLSLSGGKTANGTRIVLAARSKATTQSFSLGSVAPVINNGNYTFAGLASKKNIEAKTLGANAALQLNKANKKSKNQKFTLTYDQKTGYYTIKSASKKLVLDVKGGAVIFAKPNAKSYSQKWFVKKNSNGSLTFINAKTGKALEPKGKAKKNKTSLVVSKPKNVKAQQWKAKTA